jgi:hypothetical protein
MKKVILKNRTGFSKSLFTVAIVLLSVSFVACEKDDEEKGKNSSGYKITAQVENGNSSVATVKAILDEDVLAEADYDTSEDEFTIFLPDPDEDYLEELEFTDDGEGCILDGFSAHNSKGKTIGQFAYGAAQSSELVYLGLFLYTTEDFKMIDTEEDVNISCKEGWNIIYSSFDSDGEIVALTTKKPSGMIWVFVDDTSLRKQSGSFPGTEAIEKLKAAVGRKFKLKGF